MSLLRPFITDKEFEKAKPALRKSLAFLSNQSNFAAIERVILEESTLLSADKGSERHAGAVSGITEALDILRAFVNSVKLEQEEDSGFSPAKDPDLQNS